MKKIICVLLICLLCLPVFAETKYPTIKTLQLPMPQYPTIKRLEMPMPATQTNYTKAQYKPKYSTIKSCASFGTYNKSNKDIYTPNGTIYTNVGGDYFGSNGEVYMNVAGDYFGSNGDVYMNVGGDYYGTNGNVYMNAGGGDYININTGELYMGL